MVEGGSPHLAVFCDFDGTITRVDGTDALLTEFALPQWREWEALWTTGEISSRECMARQVSLIRADRETVIRFAESLPVDPGFQVLAECCAERAVPLTIVSGGLDIVVETVLRRAGLLHIPFFANHVHWDQDGNPALSFPYAAADCQKRAGTCKCAIAAMSRSLGARSVYIGDGRSDFCVAERVQVIYAKSELLDYCKAKGLAHRPFESLSDVTDDLFSREPFTA